MTTMQPIPALPIDAEEWWIVYMRSALVGRSETYAQGVRCLRKIPAPPEKRPSRMIIVRKDGGNVRGLFDYPRVQFDIWHEDSPAGEKHATDLASLVVALAFDAPGTAGCVRVTHQSGPLSIADPSGQPRRTVLIEAKHRTAVLT